MKKVILINIQGIVFHVDEDAHEILQNYLHEVQEYFSHVEFGDEIYNDFELRLVELLKEKLTKSKEVITLADIEHAISILGKVGDFDKTQQKKSNTHRSQTTRKLYRDPEHATFGGVAAGISAYWHVDVVWIRLAFFIALFLNGLGLIAYLIMWIIVPKARTISQRMEMKGEPLQFENIEHNIREEYKTVKNNFTHYTSTPGFQQSKNAFANTLRVTGNYIWLFAKAMAALIGLFLVMGGVLLAIGLMFSWVPVHYYWPWEEWHMIPYLSEVLTRIIPSGMVMPFLISIWLIILIPVLTIIYGGIKLVFRIHAKDQVIGSFLFVIWMLSLLFAGSIIFMQYPKFQEERTISEKHVIEHHSDDTLKIFADYHMETEHASKSYLFHDYKFVVSPEKTDIAGHVQMRLHASHGSDPEIVLNKTSLGENYYQAGINANSIDYQWTLEGNTIYLDDCFYLKPETYFRVQKLKIDLFIPIGTIIFIDESLQSMVSTNHLNSNNDYFYHHGYWRMTDNGLRKIHEIQ